MPAQKFYWIKLKTDFFSLNEIDFLLSQKNGCQYVVLYQMLCLKTANNNGELSVKMGEMIVPYDVSKIVRETKYFDYDTVTIALELFKRLGLVYEQDDGVLKIAALQDMVGSESASKEAVKKREYRARLADKERTNKGTTEGTEKGTNCPTEYRDRDRDRDREKSIEIEKEKKKTASRFQPPTVAEVKTYCQERQNNVDAERFVDYYTANGWKVGKNSMKDWKAAVRTWERNDNQQKPKQTQPTISEDQSVERFLQLLDENE